MYINCPFPSCMKTFASKWNLKRHYNVHKTAEVFKCHLCESMFKKHLQLKNHLSVHLGLKPFSCKTCSDSFVSKGELKKHERRHKLYQCTEENCQKISFITFHALRRHIKNEHPKCKFNNCILMLYGNSLKLFYREAGRIWFSLYEVFICLSDYNISN